MSRRLLISVLIVLATAVVGSPAVKRTSKTAKADKTKVEKNIKQTNRRISANSAQTQQSLQQLTRLNTEIAEHSENIRMTQNKVSQLDTRIVTIEDSVAQIEKKVAAMRASYADAVRKFNLNRRSATSLLAYVLSAESFTAAYRRVRYLREFSKWRQQKSEQLAEAVDELKGKRATLDEVKAEKANSLVALTANQKALESKKATVNEKVAKLNREGNALREELEKQKARDDQLDREIKNLLLKEKQAADKAKKRAEAEAKKRAADEAKKRAEAEAKKRAAEEAKKRAEEEAKKNQKAVVGKSSTAAPTQGKKTSTPPTTKPERTEIPTLKAEQEKPATVDNTVRPAAPTSEPMTARFESHKGSMYFPVTGNYMILCRFGAPKFGTLKNKSRSVDIRVDGGQARAIFDGSVSSVSDIGDGVKTVIITHGAYRSVYINIQSTSLRHGMSVKAGQVIGPVAESSAYDNRRVLSFQMLKSGNGFTHINPLEWVR